MQISGKKIGVWGLGKTGLAALCYLKQNGAEVICGDDNAQSIKTFSQLTVYQEPIFEDWSKLDYIVCSPGVPLHYPTKHKILELSEQFAIPIISDVDLFYLNADNSGSKFIAITGTNGKSTTTSWTGHLLAHANFVCGGNIGVPTLEIPTGKPGYILELSSYQIELLRYFEADVSVILNITPAHLSRYKSFDDYAAAKLRLIERSKSTLLNVDDEYLQQARKPQHYSFSLHDAKADFVYANDIIFDNLSGTKLACPLPAHLVGEHNRYNLLASYAIAKIMGFTPSEKLITSFSGLPHRLEYLGQKLGVKFYNDSKATNPLACQAALSSLKNILWLAGGLYDGQNFAAIGTEQVKKLYCFGEAASHLASFATNRGIPHAKFKNLEEAFASLLKELSNLSSEEYTVLLSPGHSSFDEFKNFEARGEFFKELVSKYLQQ